MIDWKIGDKASVIEDQSSCLCGQCADAETLRKGDVHRVYDVRIFPDEPINVWLRVRENPSAGFWVHTYFAKLEPCSEDFLAQIKKKSPVLEDA